ncbi:MAG: peptidylprolyl isomerase [Pseudomonadota bacterium]
MLRAFCLTLAFLLLTPFSEAQAVDENFLIIELQSGEVCIEMMPNVAPGHVQRITELAKEKFYDGVVFHRVIEGFMAQTGDPTGRGTGGSNKPDLQAEFSDVPFDRGVVGMARTSAPHSANSQFFIMFDEGHFLNNQYTVWGKVVKGMEAVDNIKRGEGQSGVVKDPDKMISVRVAAACP